MPNPWILKSSAVILSDVDLDNPTFIFYTLLNIFMAIGFCLDATPLPMYDL